MKTDHMQIFEHNLTLPDDVLFRKRGVQGPELGSPGKQKHNHKWRIRGFVTNPEFDSRLTITEDGYKWET
jgi:hypothetical protein